MNSENVTASKPKVGGAVFTADTTATLPTTAVATLTGFDELGYLSEDGITNSNSMTVEETKAWGGDVVLSDQTEKSDKWKFKFIESTNVNVLKAVFGPDNVTGTALSTGISIKKNNKEQKLKAWVFDMIMKGGNLRRVVLPKAKVTSVGDIVYKDGEPVGYEVELTCEADSAGNTSYEYMQAPASPSPDPEET